MAYCVNSFDASAEGMERLRNQSESILLAYPCESSTPGELLAILLGDLDSCERAPGFGYSEARQAIESWYAEDGESILAEELAAIQWHEFEAEDGESPIFRIYLESPPYRFEFDKLSGTGILIRLSDAAETLRYTGTRAEELSQASAEELEAEGDATQFEEESRP